MGPRGTPRLTAVGIDMEEGLPECWLTTTIRDALKKLIRVSNTLPTKSR